MQDPQFSMKLPLGLSFSLSESESGFSRLHKIYRKIVQILILQGPTRLTIWFLDLGIYLINHKLIYCSADTLHLTFLLCFYLSIFIAPTVGSIYCMSRFLFGTFCNVERLYFSKQYLEFQQSHQTANAINKSCNCSAFLHQFWFAFEVIFLLQFWFAFEVIKYHLRLDSISTFFLVKSYKLQWPTGVNIVASSRPNPLRNDNRLTWIAI